ncbi:MAG: hypothetical protein ABI813_06275 [Bacteroidota bacterium]
MKTALSNILAFTFLFVVVASCKKSNGNQISDKSKTTLLTQSSWKIQTVGIDADKNGEAETDMTATVPACQRDNIFSFKSDGTGTMDEAMVKCAQQDPQTTDFTWSFSDNETILSGDFSFTDGDASILSMNDTSLTIAYDDDFNTGTTYHVIATFKH